MDSNTLQGGEDPPLLNYTTEPDRLPSVIIVYEAIVSVSRELLQK